MSFRGRKLKRAVQRFGAVTVNKISIAAIKSGRSLPMLQPGSVLALGTAGRKSGKYRLTPMGCVKESEDRYLVVAEHGTRSDWFRNAKAAGAVDVWIGGRLYGATVRELPNRSPGEVLNRMRSKAVAMMNRALRHDACVVEVALRQEQSSRPLGTGTR